MAQLSCCISSDIGLYEECDDVAVAGIDEAWIANAKDISAWAEDATTGHVTGITMCPDKCFYRLQALREGSGATEAITSKRGKQTSTTTYEVQFYAETPAEMANVRNAMGGKFVVIYKDHSGRYRVVGRRNALEIDSGTYASGKARDDDNSWTLNLVAIEGSKRGGVRVLQVPGNPGDTQEILNNATRVYVEGTLASCSLVPASCGCAGE